MRFMSEKQSERLRKLTVLARGDVILVEKAIRQSGDPPDLMKTIEYIEQHRREPGKPREAPSEDTTNANPASPALS